jgi:glucosamine--fructose-6-phosphate aminotransferase (isomerizing)
VQRGQGVGETTDTLAALREARRQGAKVLGIVNVIGSSIYRESDEVLHTRAGPEICVASTKAYITQLIALYLLTLHFGKVRKQLSEAEIARLIAGMKLLPEQVQHILDNSSGIVELSKALSAYHDFFFIGRGLDYPASLEAALKLKEISYIHADSYAAGELKHGPLALITDGTPVVAMCLQSNLYEKMLSNVKIVAARGARIIAIVKENDRETEKSVAEIIRVPEADDLLTPVLAIIPPYLLTYYIAKYLNREIDQPRNLAKSVTVE